MTYDTSVAPRRYVRINMNSDALLEDEMFTPEDARDANERLAADGSIYRWIPFADEPGEVNAA